MSHICHLSWFYTALACFLPVPYIMRVEISLPCLPVSGLWNSTGEAVGQKDLDPTILPRHRKAKRATSHSPEDMALLALVRRQEWSGTGHQELKGLQTSGSRIQKWPGWKSLPILCPRSHPTPCRLTLISFPQPVSFTFPKSRWRSQYVRDEYFISCVWVGGRAVITRGGSAAQPCLGRRG